MDIATTKWTDMMILEAVHTARMLSIPAWFRALELADLGCIDAKGTWKLTPKGLAIIEVGR